MHCNTRWKRFLQFIVLIATRVAIVIPICLDQVLHYCRRVAVTPPKYCPRWCQMAQLLSEKTRKNVLSSPQIIEKAMPR